MIRSFCLLGLSMAPSFATGQCLLCAPTPATQGTAPRTAPRPIAVEIEAALDFSRITTTGSGAGSVVIDPRSNTRRVTGALRDLGGGALRGEVRVTGEPMHPVRVVLPASVTLTSSTGGVIVVHDLTTDLAAGPALGPDGTLRFGFGGRLDISRADAGDYRGRIPITVEYP